MTEERDQEQPTKRIPWKHMQITTFAWDEKVEQVKKLQQQNKQLITALEWYASNKNWGTFEEYGLDIGDGGEHARTALQQIKGVEES